MTRIFLDHSVVQIPFNILYNLLIPGKNLNNQYRLISLNMGSIVNSGKKNWNTKYVEYYDSIKEADKALYNLLRINPSLPEYDEIIGTEIKDIKIMYDPEYVNQKKRL